MNRPLTIPLFPLSTVLFPGGPLRLRIFEARYVDMVGRCMREGIEFGVAMIVAGREVGPARTALVGTTARIVDFEPLSDGLLGIVVRGASRFELLDVTTQPDGLNLARIRLLPAEAVASVPKTYASLVDYLRQAYRQVGEHYGDIAPQFDDASWVSMRLAELLPLQSPERQHCLELNDGLQRLQYLDAQVKSAADSG